MRELLLRTGQTADGERVTPQMIRDLVETFGEAGPVPITDGIVQLGTVTGVSATSRSRSLYGELDDPANKLATRIARTEDGTYYLKDLLIASKGPDEFADEVKTFPSPNRELIRQASKKM